MCEFNIEMDISISYIIQALKIKEGKSGMFRKFASHIYFCGISVPFDKRNVVLYHFAF